jgi:hypothetical protein
MRTITKLNLLTETEGDTSDGQAPAVQPDYTLTLPKAVFQLHRFASKDENRTALNNVRITQHGPQAARTFIATATDGHRLCTVEFTAADTDDCGLFPSDVLIPASILNSTRPKAKLTSGVLSGTGDVLSVQTGELSGTFDKAGEWRFPDTQQVIPPRGARDGVACRVAAFNLHYLADLAAMCKSCGERNIAPELSWPAHNLEPLRADVQLGGCDVVYVQMPMALGREK